MKNISTKRLVKLAAVAAIYVVLTYALGFMAYGNIQFRIAEALMLLCCYKKDYGIALTIGCLVANLFSPMAIIDVPFGTLATVLSVLCMIRVKNLFLASLFPVVFNGVIVGIELKVFYDLPLIISGLEVAFGEFVCISVVGVILFKLLEKNQGFMKLITE